MTKQEIIRQFIRDYMREHDLKQHELSRLMGHGDSYINDVLNQPWGFGGRKLASLDAFFHFPADLLADADDPPPAKKSWVDTVADLKADPPLYARAWSEAEA